MPKLILFPALLFTAVFLSARQDLSSDQLKMFHDPAGWEYITVGDVDSGIRTQHTCFDGHPHPGECSGVLTFHASNTFSQQISIHHQKVSRAGTYQLNGAQLVFIDELGTRDGPYTLAIDLKAETLTLDMPQVHMLLELRSQYKADLKAQRSPTH